MALASKESRILRRVGNVTVHCRVGALVTRGDSVGTIMSLTGITDGTFRATERLEPSSRRNCVDRIRLLSGALSCTNALRAGKILDCLTVPKMSPFLLNDLRHTRSLLRRIEQGHRKRNRPDPLRISYQTGLSTLCNERSHTLRA